MTEKFYERYKMICDRAFLFSNQARLKGPLILENLIDQKKLSEGDIFERGINFLMNGTDCAVVERILTNVINREQNQSEKQLKLIQKEAVYGIYNGLNTEVLRQLLNSCTDLSLEEDDCDPDDPKYFE